MLALSRSQSSVKAARSTGGDSVTIDQLFWTQIGTTILLLLPLSGLGYKLYSEISKAKDATIESLKQNVSFLKDQMEVLKQNTPDILVERLSKRTRTTGSYFLRDSVSAEPLKETQRRALFRTLLNNKWAKAILQRSFWEN